MLPHKIDIDPAWRVIPQAEFFVDFETVSNLDDSFGALPSVGGQPMIVQIGCGHIGQDGAWCFSQWTVDALAVDQERRILDAWLAHLNAVCSSHAIGLESARICHWSGAEPANLETAYNSARNRHPSAAWPESFPWFDLLQRVIRAAPVAVTGAFNFGLKSVAKAMQAAGMIDTIWDDGPLDGLGAMVAFWNAARECSTDGTALSTHPLILAVSRYNQIDCRTMYEVISWLRDQR